MSQKSPNLLLNQSLKLKNLLNIELFFLMMTLPSSNFVHQILMVIFNKTEQEAEFIATKIHNEGAEIVGVYPLEIAETKQAQTLYNAKKNGYPLKCELEECEEEE